MMKEKNLPSNTTLQDIKKEKITEDQLNELITLSGSIESLFSKRSRQYRARGLHEKRLSDEEMKELILEDYTFLNRPVYVDGTHISMGKIDLK